MAHHGCDIGVIVAIQEQPLENIQSTLETAIPLSSPLLAALL